jgi:hypothetical protein
MRASIEEMLFAKALQGTHAWKAALALLELRYGRSAA